MNTFDKAALFVSRCDNQNRGAQRLFVQTSPLRALVLRTTLTGTVCCAMLLGATTGIVKPVLAQSSTSAASTGNHSISLPLDKDLELPYPTGSTFRVTDGDSSVRVTATPEADENGKYWLSIEPLKSGSATIVVETPGRKTQTYNINVADAAATTADATTVAPAPTSVPVTVTPTMAPVTSDVVSAPTPVAPLPSLRTPDNIVSTTSVPSSPLPAPVTPSFPANEPSVTPLLPQPSLPTGHAAFPSAPTWPRQRNARAANSGRTITVTAGLARFLSFKSNILSVFYSDLNVMDARAMNARTVAVTGTAPGKSTLAVFVARNATDVVGQPEIFNIVVESPTPRNTLPTDGRDASTIELAIRSALNDPRVQVRVIQQPNGGFAASLTGALRNETEINAAKDTAALFVPREQVISALYADPFSPTLAQAQNPSTPVTQEEILQAKLRQITGNESIELISMPTGLAVKAEVDSATDADALLGLLPSLNTRVLPFIVVHNGNNGGAATQADGSRYYGSDRPILVGEDQEITRRLREVTGVRTVYAMRTAQNAIAVYGTVRNRTEYDTVRRYLVMLPLIGPATIAQTSSWSSSGSVPAAGGAPVNTGANAGAGRGIPNYTPANMAVGAATPANGRPLVSPQLQGAQFNANAQITPSTGGAVGTGAAIPSGIGAQIAPTAPGTGIGANTGTGAATGVVATPAGAVGPTGAAATGPTNAAAVGAGGLNNGFLPGTTLAPNIGGGYYGIPTGGMPLGYGAGAPGNYSFSQEGASLPNSYAISQAQGYNDSTQSLISPYNAAQQPATGYRQSVNLQMFVRILDEDGQSVRRVTAETSLIEISRSALKSLGIEGGSATITQETPGTTTPSTPIINPVTGAITGLLPGIINPTIRQIDPTVRAGIFTAGNGFAGGGPFRSLDPIRATINALYQKGNARILSQPNITAVEGSDAQIVVGGERPVPSAVATGQAVGTSIVFRRYGIILTMRPTITDDDTIILQIRADVTELDNTTSVNINGAVIPGEKVRSINTTMNVRDGDTIVMGGLITNDRRESTSRIPLLSSLPVLGSLFKSRRFENNETELAIVMTPRIQRSPASVNTKEAIQRVPALPDLPTNQQGTAVFGLGGTSNGN